MTYEEAFLSLEEKPEFRMDFRMMPLMEISKAALWFKRHNHFLPEHLYFEVINDLYLSGQFEEECAPKMCELMHRAIEMVKLDRLRGNA